MKILVLFCCLVATGLYAQLPNYEFTFGLNLADWDSQLLGDDHFSPLPGYFAGVNVHLLYHGLTDRKATGLNVRLLYRKSRIQGNIRPIQFSGDELSVSISPTYTWGKFDFGLHANQSFYLNVDGEIETFPSGVRQRIKHNYFTISSSASYRLFPRMSLFVERSWISSRAYWRTGFGITNGGASLKWHHYAYGMMVGVRQSL